MPFFWNLEGLNPNAVTGSYRRDIDFTSVLSNGTTMVSVICPSPHGLTRLDIVAIYGLSDSNANGFYYVSEVTSATSFTYETLYPTAGGSLETENTILFAASIGVPYGYIKVPYLASGGGTPPVNVVPPVITESCVNTGTWTGSEPIVYTYQWYLDGVAISGATTQCSITGNSVVVTATNAYGSSSVTAYSGPAGWNTSLYEFKYLPGFVDTESIRLGTGSNIYIFSMNRTMASYQYPIVTKFNFDSNQIIWNKRIGDNTPNDSSGGWSPDVMRSNTNNGYLYILTNNFYYYPVFSLLTIIDGDGNLINRKKFQSDDPSLFFETDGIYLSNDNSYLIGIAQHSSRCALLKIDLSGNLIFSKSYQITSGDGANRFKASTMPSGDIYAIYREVSSGVNVNFKVDSSGNYIWANKFNYSGEFFGTGDLRFITTDNNNSLIQCHNEGDNNSFCYLTKQSSVDGSIIWQKKITPDPSYGSIYIWDVTTDAQLNIYICGWVGTDPRVGFAMKYDSSGNLLWCNGVYDPANLDSEIELDGIQIYQDKILSAVWLNDIYESTASMVKLAQNGSGIGDATDYLGRLIVYNDVSSLISSTTSSDISITTVVLDSETANISSTSYSAAFGNFDVDGFDVQQFVPPATPLP